MFKRADPRELMLEDELLQYEELEDTVTVYRGVTSHNAKNIKALSWTLDREKAEWFAHRFNEDGTAPTVTLNGVENGGETKDEVTVTAPSETATVKVIKDGEEIKYTIGDEITEAGTYHIIVEDEIGNSTEYSFEIVEGISGWVIFLIILGSLLLVGGIVVFILKKKEII